jgi:hypothetical protein
MLLHRFRVLWFGRKYEIHRFIAEESKLSHRSETIKFFMITAHHCLRLAKEQTDGRRFTMSSSQNVINVSKGPVKELFPYPFPQKIDIIWCIWYNIL